MKSNMIAVSDVAPGMRPATECYIRGPYTNHA